MGSCTWLGDRLLAVCTLPGQPTPTSVGVSAALALIEALAPEDEVQGALAVHIAGLDAALRNVLSRLGSHSMERRTVIATNAATKLERTFQTALKSYHTLKHGHRQTITIERVEIQAGANAVIGRVSSRP